MRCPQCVAHEAAESGGAVVRWDDHGQHREAGRRALARPVPRPGRPRARQALHAEGRRAAVARRRRHRGEHRRVGRPAAGAGDGRRVGAGVARGAVAPQAQLVGAVRRHPARARAARVGRAPHRRRRSRRDPALGHDADGGLVTVDGAQDPPDAVAGAQARGQGRAAGPQPRRRRQPAAHRRGRARLPHPRPGRRARRTLRAAPADGAVPRLHRRPVRRDGRAAGPPARPAAPPGHHRRVGDAGPRGTQSGARPRATSGGRCRSRASSSTSWPSTSPARGRRTSSSPACGAGRCAPRASSARC